jgi:phage gp45-like
VVISIEDRRYRLTGLAEGEVALYDDLGQVVHLRRGGLFLESPLNVTVKAGQTLRLEGDTVQLHAATCFQWDVAGYGQQTFALGGEQWKQVAWTVGAVMVPAPPQPVQPPEIGSPVQVWP